MSCKYFEQRDTSPPGSDIFDHPNYKFFCHKDDKTVPLYYEYRRCKPNKFCYEEEKE